MRKVISMNAELEFSRLMLPSRMLNLSPKAIKEIQIQMIGG